MGATRVGAAGTGAGLRPTCGVAQASRGRAWRTYAVAAGVVLLASLLVSASLLAATHGAFVYTLDDAYIHLSLAEQVLHGGYGVNPGEAASASSSLVFPYIDAALLGLGLGGFAPLAVNAAALAASVALLQGLARDGGLIGEDDSALAGGLVVAFLALCLDLVGLMFSGMEHGLQVAATLAALLGVQRLARGGRVAWLAPVLVAAPLIRPEGAAVLLAGALAIAIDGRPRLAAGVVAAGVGLAVAFLARLHALGLPWAPSSVLVKAHALGGGPMLASTLTTQPGVLLAAMATVPVLTELADRRVLAGGRKLEAGGRIALFASPILLAHLVLAPVGWLHRYEAYALALGLGSMVLLYGGRLRGWMRGRGPTAPAVAALLLALLFFPYLSTTLDVAENARSVELQQVQMRRFAVALDAPVAVNDVGQVSWRNPRFVLDLYGLASEPARLARLHARSVDWMDTLSRAHGVQVAMIYDSWFPKVPSGWARLGELRLTAPTAFEPTVSFYAVDADARLTLRLRRVLAGWAAGLPAGASFAFAPDGDRAAPPRAR